MTAQVRHLPALDALVIEDETWLDLGKLRALVRDADARGWADSSLVSHGVGGAHPSRSTEWRTGYRLMVEGEDPEGVNAG